MKHLVAPVHTIKEYGGGGITPCITNPALLHTVPLDNIVATIISTHMLTLFSPPRDLISYQMEQVTLA
jgi:hypothetical protein